MLEKRPAALLVIVETTVGRNEVHGRAFLVFDVFGLVLLIRFYVRLGLGRASYRSSSCRASQ